MNDVKFYICKHCKNIIVKINDAGVPVMCCGEKMTLLEPGTVEASKEKHIPVIEKDGERVKISVGSEAHPMLEEHSIMWIYLLTDKGGYIKYLNAEEKPEVYFYTPGETPVKAYAYCNLHGLWEAAVNNESDETPADKNKDYVVCKCRNVTYFDILNAVNSHSSIDNLLEMFNDVKNVTNCSTGCGGCYNKVMDIISDAMFSGKA